jgi:hypothetical protein
LAINNFHFKFKLNSKEFFKSQVESQDSIKCLYLGQREYATVSFNDKCIDLIGSDSATTCHVLLLVDEGMFIIHKLLFHQILSKLISMKRRNI